MGIATTLVMEFRDTDTHLGSARAKPGEELALQHDFGLLSYQTMAVAQHVAADADAAASAILRLVEDPSCVSGWELRAAKLFIYILTGLS